jgi:solute carrier family 24 (sodium/potassium/calcium exchanger), member 3
VENSSSNNSTSKPTDNDDNDEEKKTCDEPSINDYPPDLFTQTQRRFGAILFHIAFVIYLCVALMRVCDIYFLPSLECISERLQLDQDVAGATFMAAGSSAPEVFISLIGVFVSKSDAGIGAIVGSAVFNILFVIGICGLFIVNVSLTFKIESLKSRVNS